MSTEIRIELTPGQMVEADPFVRPRRSHDAGVAEITFRAGETSITFSAPWTETRAAEVEAIANAINHVDDSIEDTAQRLDEIAARITRAAPLQVNVFEVSSRAREGLAEAYELGRKAALAERAPA